MNKKHQTAFLRILILMILFSSLAKLRQYQNRKGVKVWTQAKRPWCGSCWVYLRVCRVVIRQSHG